MVVAALLVGLTTSSTRKPGSTPWSYNIKTLFILSSGKNQNKQELFSRSQSVRCEYRPNILPESVTIKANNEASDCQLGGTVLA